MEASTPTIDWIIVRHGQSVGNARGILQGRSDFPLTETGQRQASQLAAWLETTSFKPRLVATSPLIRALETARVLCTQKCWPNKPICFDELQEVDFGILDGMLISRVHAQFPRLYERLRLAQSVRSTLNPKAERPLNVAARASRIVETLATRVGSGTVVMVTHGAFAQHILRHILGMSSRSKTLFTLLPTSVSIIRQRGKHSQVILLGATPHNPLDEDIFSPRLSLSPRTTETS